MVELIDWRIPLREVEKLQMSSAICMDGIGRSCSLGGGGGGTTCFKGEYKVPNGACYDKYLKY